MNNEAAVLARMKSRRNGDAKYSSPSDNDDDAAESFVLRSTSKLARGRNRVVLDQPEDEGAEDDAASGIVVGDFESYAPENPEDS